MQTAVWVILILMFRLHTA